MAKFNKKSLLVGAGLATAGILAAGLSMNLDYGQTWTCYNGREKACGKCGACNERLEAFTEQNVNDPLIYEG